MREYSTPAGPVVPERTSLTDDVLAHVRRDPGRVLFRRRPPGGPLDAWADVSVGDFAAEVVAVAKGLVATGVQAGDPVGLLGAARYEWAVLDYALWWVGAVPVPIHATTAAQRLASVLGDSRAVACVGERETDRAELDTVREVLPALRRVWTLTDDAIAALTARGARVSDAELEVRRSAVGTGSRAMLLHTSGTTGPPRGCPLTHGNLMAGAGAVVDALGEVLGPPGASTLLCLPPAHYFARVGQVGCGRAGTTVGHAADLTELRAALPGLRPTFVVALPVVLEQVYAAAAREATGGRRGRLLAAAAATAVAWSRAREQGGPGRTLRARHAAFDRLVHRRLRAALGGRTTYALSGGGRLADRLAHLFRGSGVTVLQAYGLTEAAGALTANVPGGHRVGTVGRPLPGVRVRVGDDGELLFRGGQVFDGYSGGASVTTATADEVLSGGWLHSGDLGEIDEEGFVRLTGRRSEVIVTAGGKGVVPSVLEDRLRAHPLVDHCLVVGDGRPYVAALVTLDEQAATAWARTHGRPVAIAALAEDPDLRAEVRRAVDAANTAVSQAESIRAFRVLGDAWTEDGGQLTATLEVRRSVVLAGIHAQVESLYA